MIILCLKPSTVHNKDLFLTSGNFENSDRTAEEMWAISNERIHTAVDKNAP
jgi:hypothetical protein